MSNTITAERKPSRKTLVTSFTLASVLALTTPIVQSRVYATPSPYEWVKHVDHDLLGGYYSSVASSASGSHLMAAVNDGGEGYTAASPLFISDDYGATWENVTEDIEDGVRNYWQSVDVSNDGQTMVAASDYSRDLETLNDLTGKIFISYNAGTTWENISPDDTDNWESVVVSGDGSRIVAVADDDEENVHISDDGGDTWDTSPVDDVDEWHSLSISDDGDTILVGGETSEDEVPFVYLSTNDGDSWNDILPEPVDLGYWTQTAMSASGDKLLVSVDAWNDGDDYSKVFVSEDTGDNWIDVTPEQADSETSWETVAMSDDGSTMTALSYEDQVYISDDNGDSWAEEIPGAAYEDETYLHSIDLNANGSRIITASDDFAYSGYNSLIDRTVKFTSAENGKPIVLTLPSGTTLTCHSSVKESGLSAQDGVYSYPLGLVDFCFSGADAENEVSLIFVTDLKPNEVAVRKYNPNSKQYATIAGASVTETTYGGEHALQVTYTITDNGPLDADPDVGEVADPVGLAVLAVGAPNTGLSPQDTTPIAVLAAVTIGASLVALPVRRKLFSHLAPKK